MDDLISVIVPVYNCEKYVTKCIESIINQTYRNLEIILVNDGSSDNSLKVLMDYKNKDPRIKVIDKKNEGVSKARNEGIKVCKGDYITFVDADDWLELDMYEKMHNILVKEKVDMVRVNYYKNASNFDILFTGKNCNLANRKINNKEIVEKIIPSVLKDDIQALCPTFMYASKFRNYFSNEIFLGEDKLFCLELLSSIESIYISNVPYYHYFYNNNSSNFNNLDYKKNIDNFINLYNKIDKLLSKNKIYDNKIYLDNFIAKWIMTNLWIIYKKKINDRNFCKNMYNYVLENENIINVFQKSDIKKLSFFDNKIYACIKNRNISKITIWCKIRYVFVKLKNTLGGKT